MDSKWANPYWFQSPVCPAAPKAGFWGGGKIRT